MIYNYFEKQRGQTAYLVLEAAVHGGIRRSRRSCVHSRGTELES